MVRELTFVVILFSGQSDYRHISVLYGVVHEKVVW